MDFKFKQKWDEDTPIRWWNECRKELNSIISDYNSWQIEGLDKEKAQTLLAKIEFGKQTIGSRDGGTIYMEELEDMERFVNSFLRNNAA